MGLTDKQASISIEKEIYRNRGGKARDRNKYRCIYEEQTEIKKTGLKEIGLNLD